MLTPFIATAVSAFASGLEPVAARWLTPGAELVASLFSQSLSQQIGLHAEIGEHALQSPVLILEGRSRFCRTGGVHRSLWLVMDASMPPYFARHL